MLKNKTKNMQRDEKSQHHFTFGDLCLQQFKGNTRKNDRNSNKKVFSLRKLLKLKKNRKTYENDFHLAQNSSIFSRAWKLKNSSGIKKTRTTVINVDC